MKNSAKLWLTLAGSALLAGCSGSNDYTPPAGAPGGKIYADACANCHGAAEQLEISAEVANVSAISAKVQKGSLSMPSFPNIQGDALKALAEYVVETGKKQ